jgi:transposase
MPTGSRRPAAQQERDRLQARRLRAAELFAAGVRQAEVSAQAVSVWHARWSEGGTDALRSRGPSGPAPRLSDTQLATVEQALLEGATANGFTGEQWTLDRVALVIERLPAYAPDLNPIEACGQPQGCRAGQPLWPDPGRGDRPGPPRHRPCPADATSRLLVPAPDRPVSLMTSQPDTQDPLD